jgi:hypothetical protein
MTMNSNQLVNRGQDCGQDFGKTPVRGVRSVALAKAATLAFAIFAFASAQQAAADPLARAQAKRMYDRLTGTPPSPAVLDTLEGKIPSLGLEGTALFIVDNTADLRSSNFYSVTLKNFATPWTNRDRTVFAPLNDYTATVIGMVRDDKDFRGVLSDDILYVGNASPAYSPSNNDHYIALESNNADLRAVLQEKTQSSLNGIPTDATAGVITSRAASEAFFIAGTNRAMFRFTLLNHLCRDMEQVHDTSRPPDRIRQDVTRSPGGDSSVFLNNCIGCHSGMDPMAQAFAYYNYNETTFKLDYTPGVVQPKYLINSDNFKPGFITPDNQWENRWRLPGLNKQLGWDTNRPGKGAGAKSLGDELAHSDAFAECQVEKVFRTVCFRTPADTTEQGKFESIVAGFKSTGSLKKVFAQTAAVCAGN